MRNSNLLETIKDVIEKHRRVGKIVAKLISSTASTEEDISRGDEFLSDPGDKRSGDKRGVVSVICDPEKIERMCQEYSFAYGLKESISLVCDIFSVKENLLIERYLFTFSSHLCMEDSDIAKRGNYLVALDQEWISHWSKFLTLLPYPNLLSSNRFDLEEIVLRCYRNNDPDVETNEYSFSKYADLKTCKFISKNNQSQLCIIYDASLDFQGNMKSHRRFSNSSPRPTELQHAKALSSSNQRLRLSQQRNNSKISSLNTSIVNSGDTKSSQNNNLINNHYTNSNLVNNHYNNSNLVNNHYNNSNLINNHHDNNNVINNHFESGLLEKNLGSCSATGSPVLKTTMGFNCSNGQNHSLESPSSSSATSVIASVTQSSRSSLLLVNSGSTSSSPIFSNPASPSLLSISLQKANRGLVNSPPASDLVSLSLNEVDVDVDVDVGANVDDYNNSNNNDNKNDKNNHAFLLNDKILLKESETLLPQQKPLCVPKNMEAYFSFGTSPLISSPLAEYDDDNDEDYEVGAEAGDESKQLLQTPRSSSFGNEEIRRKVLGVVTNGRQTTDSSFSKYKPILARSMSPKRFQSPNSTTTASTTTTSTTTTREMTTANNDGPETPFSACSFGSSGSGRWPSRRNSLQIANSLVGSYEESLLTGRMSMAPSKPLEFIAQIGVHSSGEDGREGNSIEAKKKDNDANKRQLGFFSSHAFLTFPAHYYDMPHEDCPSPYVGDVDLESNLKQGKIEGVYRIPLKGRLQIMIKNLNKSLVKLFLIPYDYRDMPVNTRTFLRMKQAAKQSQTTTSLSSSSTTSTVLEEDKNKQGIKLSSSPSSPLIISSSLKSWEETKTLQFGSGGDISNSNCSSNLLRSIAHCHFIKNWKGQLFLFKSIRLVFMNRSMDEPLETWIERPNASLLYTPISEPVTTSIERLIVRRIANARRKATSISTCNSNNVNVNVVNVVNVVNFTTITSIEEPKSDLYRTDNDDDDDDVVVVVEPQNSSIGKGKKRISHCNREDDCKVDCKEGEEPERQWQRQHPTPQHIDQRKIKRSRSWPFINRDIVESASPSFTNNADIKGSSLGLFQMYRDNIGQ